MTDTVVKYFAAVRYGLVRRLCDLDDDERDEDGNSEHKADELHFGSPVMGLVSL